MRTALLLSLALVSCQPGSDATVDPSNPDTMKPIDKPPIKIVPSGFENKSGSRLKTQYAVLRSADGLALSYTPNIYDSKLATTCTRGTASDGKTRCLPFPIASAYPASNAPQWFSDAVCTSPVFYTQIKDCGTNYGDARHGSLTQVIDGCSATSVVELGSRLDPLAIYLKDTTAGCRKVKPEEVSWVTPGGWKLMDIKRRLEPFEFAELTTETVTQ